MPPSPSARPALVLPDLPEDQRQLPVEEWYRLGFEAEQTDQLEYAATYFAAILHRQPRNPYAMMDLARIYFQLFERDEALALMHKASRWAGEDPEFWYELALIYQDARADDQAERCYLLARKHAAGNPTFPAALISFYDARGRIPEARQALAHASKKCAADPWFAALDGLVLSRAGDTQDAGQALRRAIANLPPQHPFQINSRYALARLLADEGREQESIDILREAKTIQEEDPQVARLKEIAMMVAKVREDSLLSIGAEDIAGRWAAESCPTHPPLGFLLGYPRSGTTLLEQVIDAHSAVQSFEETNAFLQALRRLFPRALQPDEKPWPWVNDPDRSRRDHARSWYFEFLRRMGATLEPSTFLLDKNPGLIGHVQMVSRLFPDAKLVFMVRDPRDICLSAYQTQVMLTPFSVNWLDWEDTVRHCHALLSHWRALRDRLPNPWIEVRYEDLVSDLEGTARRVMAFLDLPWQEQQADFATHARKRQIFSPTIHDVRGPLRSSAPQKWQRFALDYSTAVANFPTLLEHYSYPTAKLSQ
jgi:tetratricopeptide (TPR) repeat protein